MISPMISFMGLAYCSKLCDGVTIKESCDNIQKMYSARDNETNMSSLWPIDWQLSNPLKIFYSLIFLSILMLICSPQFWMFLIGFGS